MSDLSVQVQLQQQLNRAIAETNKLILEQNKLLSSQSEITRKISTTLGSGTATRNIRDMTAAVRENEDAFDSGKDTAEEMAEVLDEVADNAEKSSSSFGMLKKAAGGLYGVLSGGIGILGSFAGGIFNIGATLTKTAFSILAFPFKLFGGLVDLAQSGGGGNPLAEAYEEVREVFGDLASGPGKAVVDTFQKVRKNASSLAGTGLSVRRVFGYGRGGIAALLKDINELAKASGDNFARLQQSFVRMGAKAIVFQRGLGLSKEEFGELAALADSRGGDVEGFMTEFSKTAITTAKAFGLGVKDMSKGMKELSQDVSNFGHLGPKAFAPITVYARKLGLEIKDMAGVMGKFSGFTDTTEAASKMSQAFGINVDSMQLMAAQNPAEKIDIMRKAFYATGKDLKNFNYQQRQYLQQLTGLEGKSLDAAFSLEKQGINYDDIAKKSEDAGKQQMTQLDVLKELSKGMKRLIQTMSGRKASGFFDAFLQGFEKGIMRSKEMQALFKGIRKGLKSMRRAGVEVGEMFIKMFPGVNKILTNFTKLFEPKRFTKFTSVITSSFKKFFSNVGKVGKDGKKASYNLMDEIISGLKEAFKDDKAGQEILSGLEEFARGAGNTLAGLAEWALDKIITPATKKVGEFFDKLAAAAAKEDGFAAKIGAIAKKIAEEIEEAFGGTAIGRILGNFLEPFSRMFSGESSAVNNFVASLRSTATSAGGLFEDLGKSFAVAISEALKGIPWTKIGLTIAGAIAAGLLASKALKGGFSMLRESYKKRRGGGGGRGRRGGRRRRGLLGGLSSMLGGGMGIDWAAEALGGDAGMVVDVGAEIAENTGKNLNKGVKKGAGKFLKGAGKFLKVGGPVGAAIGVLSSALDVSSYNDQMAAFGVKTSALEDTGASVIGGLTSALTLGFYNPLDAVGKDLERIKKLSDAADARILKTLTNTAEAQKSTNLVLARIRKEHNALLIQGKKGTAKEMKLRDELVVEMARLAEQKALADPKSELRLAIAKEEAALKKDPTLKYAGRARANFFRKEKEKAMQQYYRDSSKKAVAALKKSAEEEKLDKAAAEAERILSKRKSLLAIKNKIQEMSSEFGQIDPNAISAAAKKIHSNASGMVSSFLAATQEGKTAITAENLESTAKILKAFPDTVDALSQANAALSTFSGVSRQLKRQLDSKPVKDAVAKLVALNNAASNGEIHVSHNLRGANVKMTVKINLDAARVATTLVKTNMTSGGGPRKHLMVDDGGSAKANGMTLLS